MESNVKCWQVREEFGGRWSQRTVGNVLIKLDYGQELQDVQLVEKRWMITEQWSEQQQLPTPRSAFKIKEVWHELQQ